MLHCIILYYTSPELGDLLLGSSRGSGECFKPPASGASGTGRLQRFFAEKATLAPWGVRYRYRHRYRYIHNDIDVAVGMDIDEDIDIDIGIDLDVVVYIYIEIKQVLDIDVDIASGVATFQM